MKHTFTGGIHQVCGTEKAEIEQHSTKMQQLIANASEFIQEVETACRDTNLTTREGNEKVTLAEMEF